MVAVWHLAGPLLDMGVVILRRIGNGKGQSPFTAGRDHFHHVLIATGMPPGTAVLLMRIPDHRDRGFRTNVTDESV